MEIYLLGVLICLILFAIIIYHEGILTARELVILALVSLASWFTFAVLWILAVIYCIGEIDWSEVIWRRRRK